jgi:hypothetical protein
LSTTRLPHSRGVPIAEIAALRANGHPIDGALAAGDLLLADPHGDQRPLRAQGDAQLQTVTQPLPDDGEAGAVGKRQGRVVQFAAGRQRKAQLTPDLTGWTASRGQRLLRAGSLPELGGKGHHADAALNGTRLGYGAREAEGTQEPAGRDPTQRGTAGPGHSQQAGQSIEALGIHFISPRAAPLRPA